MPTHGLPPDCTYFPSRFAPGERLYDRLLADLPWQTDHVQIYGRFVEVPRRIAMFGADYRYSGVDHPAHPMTPLLGEIQARVEACTGLRFTGVLANLYRSGADYIGWHRDNDYPHGGQDALASVTFGAERRFLFRHYEDAERSFETVLGDGSVLVMGGVNLKTFKHSLPKMARVSQGRINLTFRHIIEK